MHEEEHTIEDVGIVTAVNGSTVSVEMQRGGGCKTCAMRGMCFSKNTPAVFKIETTIQVEPGDSVLLEVSPKARVLSSLLIFILPIVFLGIGYAIGSVFFTELIAALISMAFMGLGFFVIHFVDKAIGKDLSVTIRRKL
ncbi:MAG: hypothetical protein CVU48_02965 [Candidatus Cloacimonetes bacterium HGW-Cloacimonetes-1]|jgi:positive regulator of sigma E activity|nr:MAG: hypothetical protein CVU48_02965 [Candidatus Cloacimonetes bacterium HGW-Cloacimonetes-1]